MTYNNIYFFAVYVNNYKKVNNCKKDDVLLYIYMQLSPLQFFRLFK